MRTEMDRVRRAVLGMQDEREQRFRELMPVQQVRVAAEAGRLLVELRVLQDVLEKIDEVRGGN